MRKYTLTSPNISFIIVVVVVLGIGALVFAFKSPLYNFLWQKLDIAVSPAVITVDAELASEIGDYYFNWSGSSPEAYSIDKAVEYYEQVVLIDPVHQHAWYQLGRIDFLYGRYGYAVEKFSKNIELHGGVENDTAMRTYYMRGLTYGYMKKFEKAEEDFLTILAWHEDKPTVPEEWALYVDLSWIYFQQGQYNKMAELMVEGYKLFPSNAWVLNMYGLALLNTYNEQEAGSIFERAFREAQKLTEEDWIRAYPGNDPRIAGEGLNEMLAAIEQNLILIDNE